MSEVVLKVENLSKEFRIGKGMLKNLSAREFVIDKFKEYNPFHIYQPLVNQTTFWALDDVNFSVERGDTVGIIGRNGAGKSTLLKVLSKITPPTKGIIKSKGRVTSLLEVGTGFHPELTGKENIFLNGAILGLTRKEIKQRFDEIVDFSGVENFLETPIKRYSSGMMVRLAFSVAANLNPDILIIDEVLAVGDLDFQKKCLQKMENVSKGGNTILFVSHNNEHILRICNKGVLLNAGQVVTQGPIGDVIQTYLDHSRNLAAINLEERKDRRGNGALRVQKIHLLDKNNQALKLISPNQPFKLVFDYELTKDFSGGDVSISINVVNSLGLSVFEHSNRNNAVFFKDKNIQNTNSFVFDIEYFPFPQGDYLLTFDVWSGDEQLDFVQDALIFGVDNSPFGENLNNPIISQGTTLINGRWSLG